MKNNCIWNIVFTDSRGNPVSPLKVDIKTKRKISDEILDNMRVSGFVVEGLRQLEWYITLSSKSYHSADYNDLDSEHFEDIAGHVYNGTMSGEIFIDRLTEIIFYDSSGRILLETTDTYAADRFKSRAEGNYATVVLDKDDADEIVYTVYSEDEADRSYNRKPKARRHRKG